MKNKLFVLIGESCSGKTTLEKKIRNRKLCRNVISLTTRKPRFNEVNGIDYYFTDKLIFEIYKAQEKLLECTSYIMKNQGKVSYGIMKNDIKLDKDNYVCILNPNGYKQVLKSLGKENVVGIYINRDVKERFLTYLNRENENFYDLLEEARTRFYKDMADFEGIEEKVDYVIYNNGSIRDMMSKFLEIFIIESNNIN